MMKITGLSHLFKWENLHNWWLTKYIFAPLYALVGWPSLHIRRQTHWLQVIYKSLLGEAPPYLSSLGTITTPTHSTLSSRYSGAKK